ncbi:MAG: sugar kinase [Ignavibacteriae bacterium]|nr:sugar kinase [Ignavibacteriota bacterium]
MSLLVIGTLALDTIETPYGKEEYTLGGSATFISTSASYLTKDIRLVGIVGHDFPQKELDFFKSRGIDTSGLEIMKDQKTFHWHGVYHTDMNQRDTITTDLNALAYLNPVLSDKFRQTEYVCLGNIDPVIQEKVIKQIDKPKLIMIDTMNFWIEGNRPALDKVLKLVDIIMVNDSEARLITGENNLFTAAKKIMEYGPKILIIKKGEHGAMLFNENHVFIIPAFPLEKVFDPTGAGDSFAGGFMGWIDRTKDLSFENLKLAIVFGTVMASLSVEKFSLEGLRNLENDTIMKRFKEFKSITNFKDISL